MTENLFDQTNATPAEEFDPVAEAMSKANFSGGGREKYLPLGKGVYEYEKLAWGVSPKNGALRLTVVLKCISHPDPACVGKTREHKIKYVGTGKRTLTMVLEEFGKWLVYPFGAGAKAAIGSDKIKKMIVAAYKEQFKTIVQNQALAPGMGYAGKRVTIDVVANPTKVIDHATGQEKVIDYTNTYIDIAPDAVA